MSSRQQFLLPNVTPGTRVRLDTASGSTSPADVVDNLNQPVSGSLITADNTGRIASGDIYGPAGVTTLYLKTLDGSNNVTGTTTLTSSHPATSGSDPRVDTLIASAPGALDTLKELADALGDDASFAATVTTLLAGKENVVVHGSTASTARPTGATIVHWIGSVAPTNGVTNDEWTDTTVPVKKRYNGSAWVSLSGTSSLTDRGAWTTTTVYAVGDVVTQSGSRYVCNTAHTAGTFATDLAAAKWTVLGDASGQAAAAQTAAQTYAAAQDQATVAKLSFGQRNGSVIPFQPAPTIGQEIWQLANFQGGYNTTVLAPSITANGTNLTTKTRMFIGNMGNGDTSYRLEFDYSLSLNGWGGVSVLLTDAGGSAQGGAVRQYLIGSATNVKTGHVIFDFKSLPSSNISYFEVQLESINNSTTGSISISNVTFKRTGNEKSRPMLITKDGAGGTWPDCYFQSYDEKTRTWKIAELQFGTDGVLTPAYSLANGFATDALFNGGKIALGDPLFGQATQGSNSNPDAANVTVSTSAASMTAASLRGGNNDQVMEVWNGTAYELRCNTHGGETIRGAASYKIDTGSGLAAWTLATGLRPCRRFQVSIPTQVATTTATTFANVDHTFTVFADGVIRCDRTTTFLVDTLVRSYFEWMSSHSTQRGYIGRIGRGNLVLHEIDTISKLAAPVAPTLATSTTGGTLPAGTFFYKTTKLTAFGETTGSPSTSQVTTGTTSSNTVTFVGDANATGYGIYRGTVSGQETLIGYAPAGATSYVDTNATVPAPAAFPPVANKARLYNSAIDTQNAATTDAAWAAWYDAPTGWTFGNIYDRDSPLTRSQVGNVRSRLEGVTGSIAKNYANLEWVGADTTTLVAGTVFTATHYTFVYTPVSGDRWHDEIAARAASLSTLATMYPNT